MKQQASFKPFKVSPCGGQGSRTWGWKSKGPTSVGMSPHKLWKVQEVVLQNCEFFFLSKLLYIAFLTNLEHLVLSIGSILKWIIPSWRKRCCLIPTIFLQEYGHRFGENIHLKLLSGWLLLVHLKVIERAIWSRIFFEQGWQYIIHVAGLERGDHIIISFRAHSKFHMYVFNGTREVKKENKVWGQKHKQPHATPKKKTLPSLAFDRPHAQQVGTQSCNVDEVNNKTSRSKEMTKICFSSCSMFPTFVKYLAPYNIYSFARNSSYLVSNV